MKRISEFSRSPSLGWGLALALCASLIPATASAQPVAQPTLDAATAVVLPPSLSRSTTLDQANPKAEFGNASKRQVSGVPASQARTVGDFASPKLIAWLTGLIREHLPPAYNDERKWGQQREVWDGLELRREGIKVETKRKKKLVNAGTWTKYRVEFVEPDENLHIEFQRLESTPDGRIAFSVSVEGLLDVFGRLSQWVRDVQLISVSVNADAVCKMTMSGTVQFQLNPLKLPPDVIIKPHVDTAVIELSHFRVRRVSQIGGDFAKVLGEGAKGVVDRKIEETNQKLVEKINRQIEKQKSKMFFSMQDWLQSKLPTPSKM